MDCIFEIKTRTENESYQQRRLKANRDAGYAVRSAEDREFPCSCSSDVIEFPKKMEPNGFVQAGASSTAYSPNINILIDTLSSICYHNPQQLTSKIYESFIANASAVPLAQDIAISKLYDPKEGWGFTLSFGFEGVCGNPLNEESRVALDPLRNLGLGKPIAVGRFSGTASYRELLLSDLELD